MPTGIIITAIICVTLVVICLIPHCKKAAKTSEYEYNVVHANAPQNAVNAIEQGIRTALLVFPGEIVAVVPDPIWPGMKVPTYSIVIKTPKKVKQNDDK